MVCVGFDPWWTQWTVTAGAKYRNEITAALPPGLGLDDFSDIYFDIGATNGSFLSSSIGDGIFRIYWEYTQSILNNTQSVLSISSSKPKNKDRNAVLRLRAYSPLLLHLISSHLISTPHLDR